MSGNLLKSASAQNPEDASAPILDPMEQAILDAIDAGQNVEAVIRRENAKRAAFEDRILEFRA